MLKGKIRTNNIKFPYSIPLRVYSITILICQMCKVYG